MDEILEELKAFDGFKFFSNGHYYTYNDKRIGTSSTKLIHNYTQPFETEKMAEKVAVKENKTASEILKKWQIENKFSTTKGTILHELAQAMWCGRSYDIDYKSVDKDIDKQRLEEAINNTYPQIQQFFVDNVDRFEVIAEELIVGSEEYDIAGAVDMLFRNKLTNEIVMIDFKTNKEIKRKGFKGAKMQVPLQNLGDCNYSHYSLQLELYKYLIEKYTNLTISEHFIVYFNENADKYEIIETLNVKDEVIKILENRRIKGMESVGVILMGGSGTGKTTSLRNLPAKETVIVNVTNKPMPFKNKNGIQVVNCVDYNQIIKAIISTDKKIIVIDDSSYLMAFENFEKATIKGYDKFTTMAVNYYNLLKVTNQCNGEKIIYIVTHEEIDENGIAHPKTIGKMLSQQLVIEGLYTIVLRSMYKNETYIFQTQNDGTSVCKSPIDMFESREIPNDLAKVDEIIRDFYGFKKISNESEEK